MSKPRVAVLISGRGSNMMALIEAAQAADYPAEIALVLSNVPGVLGLDRAQEHRIPIATLDHKPFGKDREAFERELHAVLQRERIDLVCLAGFMRLLTPWFVGQWTGKMINIHPALLPSYKGLHTHERALADGVKLHGATVHFVVPGMDEGAIIAQGAVTVSDDDDADSLSAKVLKIEHALYPKALALLASGALTAEGNRVFGADGAGGTLLSAR